MKLQRSFRDIIEDQAKSTSVATHTAQTLEQFRDDDIDELLRGIEAIGVDMANINGYVQTRQAEPGHYYDVWTTVKNDDLIISINHTTRDYTGSLDPNAENYNSAHDVSFLGVTQPCGDDACDRYVTDNPVPFRTIHELWAAIRGLPDYCDEHRPDPLAEA